MAIRDRVTVKTNDGTVTSMTVARQGGVIETTDPTKNKPFYTFEMQNKEGDPTGERIIVPADGVVFISYDKESKQRERK